ncbi:hypothetical protein [Blastococcus sp. KM273128]|uniref:hypothetical protein n=1 Tax=Blastococcus sp. KM273128 TaxID=2570314 RepID=UPI001F406445|nr:hypothetical protein [Blastococcus sp. KM273128]
MRPGHVYVVDDTADWTIIGTVRHGRHIDMTGTATGMARRGQDSAWRYLIDSPLGTA